MTGRGTGAAAGGSVVVAPDSRSLGKTEKEGSVVRHDKASEARGIRVGIVRPGGCGRPRDRSGGERGGVRISLQILGRAGGVRDQRQGYYH